MTFGSEAERRILVLRRGCREICGDAPPQSMDTETESLGEPGEGGTWTGIGPEPVRKRRDFIVAGLESEIFSFCFFFFVHKKEEK